MAMFTAAVLAMALVAPLAQAHQAGDLILRTGAITVDPRENSSDIYVGTLSASVLGTKATLDSNTQLGLNFAQMLSDNLGIELLAASPFTHDVSVAGMPGGFASLNGKLGELKLLPRPSASCTTRSTASRRFSPMSAPASTTLGSSMTNSPAGAEGNGLSGLDMKDSWGLAAQVGMDHMLAGNVMVNAQVRYIDVDTTGTTSYGGANVKVDVDIDPMVYMVGLGYKF